MTTRSEERIKPFRSASHIIPDLSTLIYTVIMSGPFSILPGYNTLPIRFLNYTIHIVWCYCHLRSPTTNTTLRARTLAARLNQISVDDTPPLIALGMDATLIRREIHFIFKRLISDIARNAKAANPESSDMIDLLTDQYYIAPVYNLEDRLRQLL